MTVFTHQLRLWIACVAAVACATAATAAERILVQHDDKQRTYVVHLPKSYDGSKAVPLLIALHGTRMSGVDMLKYTDLVRKSEVAGFVLAAPDSLGLAFNDGSGRGTDVVASVADVRFIEGVADDAKKRFKIDSAKIYLVGFSSGAAMVQRIAVESQYDFAALASISDHLWVKTDRILRPRPLLLVFGTADPLNPKAGGTVSMPVRLDKPAHSVTAKAWAARLKCEPISASATAPAGVTAQLWRACESGSRVVWYEVEGLAHQWSGGAPLPFPENAVGKFTSSPSLGDLVWEFLTTTP